MRKTALMLAVTSLIIIQGCTRLAAEKFDKAITFENYEYYATNVRYEIFDTSTGRRIPSKFFHKIPMRMADDNSWIDFSTQIGRLYRIFSPKFERKDPINLKPLDQFYDVCLRFRNHRERFITAFNSNPDAQKAGMVAVTETGTGVLLLTYRTHGFIPGESYSLDCPNVELMIRLAKSWHQGEFD
ncbi:hypothetical protein MHL40_16055 [Pseudomonas luteola]|uniref:hypothetical protein n=1 Tax=Pseudomonas luteola TaxID=47886 RepID=UPI001EF57352|nr:hypothetical protein [Pseudomonas luteola]MCG7374172.1 hypothetical protein [Pseudomonas luteola]